MEITFFALFLALAIGIPMGILSAIKKNPVTDALIRIAGLLGLSRESVHQLLSPFVRSGLLVAVRGRAGGYRPGEGLLETPLTAVLAPFGVASAQSLRPPAGVVPRLVAALEAEAAGARHAVYQRTTVGQLVSRLRAEREALDWEI